MEVPAVSWQCCEGCGRDVYLEHWRGSTLVLCDECRPGYDEEDEGWDVDARTVVLIDRNGGSNGRARDTHG
jgi:hypothetical protein